MKAKLATVFLVFASPLLAGCNAPLGNHSKVSALLKSADSCVLERRYAKAGKTYIRRLQYGQARTQQIVDVMLGARRDRVVYCLAKLNVVKFYSNSRYLAGIRHGGPFFTYQGKQYRDESGTLGKLVDEGLRSVPEVVLTPPESGREDDSSRSASDNGSASVGNTR